MFVPHASMCSIDLYDIINYKSDSAFTFLHYILDNELLQDKIVLVMTRDDVDVNIYHDYVSKNYGQRRVLFFPLFKNKEYSKFHKFRDLLKYYWYTIHCSHIFTSITHSFRGLISSQMVVDLNYYATSMKNDIFDKSNKYYMGLDKVGHEYTYIVCPSELSIRLNLSEMTVPYNRYKNLGLCRNDNLLNGDRCDWLREQLQSRVSYKIHRVILYTPTHRDYEASLGNEASRSILGFNYDQATFDQFLRMHGIVFYCKLHPKQNAHVVETDLPEGIILHKANPNYGLTEMMQVSDCLLTDYTSAYFDYLLLDKPVIFNFYDLDTYIKERGVPFVPLTSITAGEIVTTESQLKRALLNLQDSYTKFQYKREFVRDLIFSCPDANSCKRVFDFIFGKHE
jgi:hypothetical protein